MSSLGVRKPCLRLSKLEHGSSTPYENEAAFVKTVRFAVYSLVAGP